MKVATTFDILGPIMVGPSSSHTAGALRIAQMAASLCDAPITRVAFTLYNSFARTYAGHGTDRALLGGILGMHTDDPDIQRSFDVARERGIAWEFTPSNAGDGLHPNTVDIDMLCADGTRTTVRGESLGGGKARLVRVNGVSVDLTGRMPAVFVAHRDVPGMLALMTGELGAAGINIAFMSSYRTTPGQLAYALFECDTLPDAEVIASIERSPDVFGVRIVRAVGGGAAVAGDAASERDFASGAELLELSEREGVSLGALMRLREADLRGKQETDSQMARVLDVMRAETSEPVAHPGRSLGGMLDGQAARVFGWSGPADALCGPTLTRACAWAMATLERSACMGIIVAAPTAGSAGVLPGALLASAEALGSSEADVTDALFCAAAIGAIIERNASVAGAEGGCQAEVGSASAMAAAALVQLLGGSAQTCLNAATLAISNLLGLVCDPVRGLVEVPCQARNAIGVANAYTAAQMALSGVALPIPFDEAVEAMAQVGHALPESLRETALGGLAAAPSVCGACK
ncbi:MAG: L-serine ammonia-lyase, iron-sulfur-dependent, subunit alpha [Coriobacteriia bacterium]|nr:L-serine ammonia-lyase, iron-sulfur-dependent, subunit alpha [Coriobacteriia bacterium]